MKKIIVFLQEFFIFPIFLQKTSPGHIAQRALEEYGFIGTASVILRTALKTSRDPGSDESFEAALKRIVAETVKIHNGYLKKHRSVFTDNYTFKPYLLDSRLRRKKKQPKFVTGGDHLDVVKIWDSVKNDNGDYARTSAMLQSCGGFTPTNHQHWSRETQLDPELDSHRCVLVHHGDPFTKLGPFKVAEWSTLIGQCPSRLFSDWSRS